MKKHLAIFLIVLFAFQAINCQEEEEAFNDGGMAFFEEEEEAFIDGGLAVVEEEENTFMEEEEVQATEEEQPSVGEEEEAGVENASSVEIANAGSIEVETVTEEEEWMALDQTAFYNDPTNKSIADFGIQLIDASLRGDEQVPRDDWVLQQLNNVGYRVDPEIGYQYFKFNITMQDNTDQKSTYLATYKIQYSTNLDIRTRVTNYTSYVAQDVKDQNGNTVQGWRTTENNWNDDVTTVQDVEPFTFAPYGQSTLVDNWDVMQDTDVQADQPLVDEGQNVADRCLQDAVNNGILPDGDWKASLYYVATQPSFSGYFYYRFTINIVDKTNKLEATALGYEDRDAATKDFTWVSCGIASFEEYLD